MTRQEAKQLLPVIQAFADGKAVDYFNGETWSALHDRPSFTDPIECYRIKPEPKLRPWRPEEVPVGALVRTRFGQEFFIISQNGGWDGAVFISERNKVKGGWQSFDTSSMHEYSTDCGTSWHPCGIMEDAK
jgi:hypothetical protein